MIEKTFGNILGESYQAESVSSFNPTGVRIEQDIFLAHCSPVNFMLRYFHEIGHILGDDLSFATGDVLYPTEAQQTSAPMGYPETFQLFLQVISSPGNEQVNDFTIYAANTILQTFTLGEFEPSTVNLHYPVSKEDLIKLLKDAKQTPGIKFNDEGEIEGESSKDGRNSELSAMAVEVGCMRILENTINSMSPYSQVSIGIQHDSLKDSHDRAFKIVQRAYEPKRTLVIPSAKDLGKTYR